MTISTPSSRPPDGIMFPKAEGGAAVIHCDAKITAREAMHGLPDGALDIIAIATETAQAMFPRRHLRGLRASG
jgi:citrate lyase subunit beta/citryl-CoA lyase